MLNKIDPQLLVNVTAQTSNPNEFECIIYANNYAYTKNFLVKNMKVNKIYEYPFILAFGTKLNGNMLTNLAQLNEVSYITSNFKVTAQIDVSKKVLQLKEIKMKPVFKPNHTVAIIDTGVSSILDLCVPQNRIAHFEDFVEEKQLPYDDNGHGTFISSILAGNGMVSGNKYSGIDKNAHIISLKALDKNGETGAITILKAMQWIYDNRRKYNIKVVCMSFGSGSIGKRDPLIIGAEVLWSAGVCVVSAAGNSGPEQETIKSPGASSRIITVGALNDNRGKTGELNADFSVADFSSRGPVMGNYKPDLIAPGVNITSAGNFNLTNQHYSVMNGTSVATPMVAGVCSLLYGKNMFLSPNEVKKILINNCNAILHDRNAEGFGLLNCDFLKYYNIY